ncbi:MAG TPA: hypothetical protein VNZ57_03245, partial [Longimicrobiales bacterium]|nr:hypothetical protein [Longimicrobiales bacterium]
ESFDTFALLALLGLGALHGINPGMGWLFAVSLGLQERSRRAVWRAMGPLALGHALAVATAITVATVVGLVIPPEIQRWIVAAALLAVGVMHLRRHFHPRFGGMRVGARELTMWSFLMASAHGAGLMVLPIFLEAGDQPVAVAESPAPGDVTVAATSHVHHGHDHGAVEIVAANEDVALHGAHAAHAAALGGVPGDGLAGLLGALIHAAGYLLATVLIAVIVYEKLGLRLLRRAWINMDVIWAGALVTTAVLLVVL